MMCMYSSPIVQGSEKVSTVRMVVHTSSRALVSASGNER